MPQTLVLSISLDPMVLETRNLLLQSAGYSVVSVLSIKEAVHLFPDGNFDLVILCHTVSRNDRERLTRFIRSSGSRVPICTVYESASECDPFADIVLEKSPLEFLTTIGDLLNKVAPRRPLQPFLDRKQEIA